MSRSRSRSRSPNISNERSNETNSESANNGSCLYNYKDILRYVRNLEHHVNEDDLKDCFSKIGEIDYINIVINPETQTNRYFFFLILKYRGYGFVKYKNSEDAKKAIDELNKQDLKGRELQIELSKRDKGYDPTPGKCMYKTLSIYSIIQFLILFLSDSVF